MILSVHEHLHLSEYANLTSNFSTELKNYFTSLSVGSSSSGSHLSTHGSGNATTSMVAGEVVQENEAMQDVATDLAHVDIGVDEAQPQQQPQQEKQEDEGISLIMEFDPHVHIVAVQLLECLITELFAIMCDCSIFAMICVIVVCECGAF
jgi:hypothetical protein